MGSSQTLTEQSRCRERAACADLVPLRRSHRHSERLAKVCPRSWQHCAHLYYSPLSLSDCSSTRIFRRTGISGPQPIRGRGLPFTISDWFRPRYEPNVCLLLKHRETFRVAVTFLFLMASCTGATSDFC